MAENEKVHPNCVNASNPYHECGVACLEKIAQGKGLKDKDKKKLDNLSGINEGEISKNGGGERKLHPSCTKASNPYHECDEICYKRITEAIAMGGKKESASKLFEVSGSFGRKKKGSEIQPKPLQTSGNGYGGSVSFPAGSRTLESLLSPKKKVDTENSESFISFEQHSEGDPHSRSFEVHYFQSVPTSKNVIPNYSKLLSKDGVTTPAKDEEEKLGASAELVSSTFNVEDLGEGATSPVTGSMNFSFSGIGRTVDKSDDEEVQSVISDVCVSVGKYHVRTSVSSILQSIIDKYGDIAANCKLESVSMRSSYLECLCSVVQELQCTPLTQLTKAKVREMLAVLKDVESAQIDVRWLRSVLNDVFETIDFIGQHQTIEAAKANCDFLLESTKKKLELQMDDLARKEKAVAEAKQLIEETKVQMSELELEHSRWDKAILSIRSKMEEFQGKSSADGLL
ncbi:PEARLI-4 domain-containing protein [Cephalotus follicularis]|uniref:PEARLI-4 domain-containing protein n=1 Tax=Cephalotus follicularis TaxID=3775 RepID=A0A1Q3BM47_CEPFO|nr:PEARLI-4 domain-containing protein [Cephalotus follicularis]